jgi:hypothetical protein
METCVPRVVLLLHIRIQTGSSISCLWLLLRMSNMHATAFCTTVLRLWRARPCIPLHIREEEHIVWHKVVSAFTAEPSGSPRVLAGDGLFLHMKGLSR